MADYVVFTYMHLCGEGCTRPRNICVIAAPVIDGHFELVPPRCGDNLNQLYELSSERVSDVFTTRGNDNAI